MVNEIEIIFDDMYHIMVSHHRCTQFSFECPVYDELRIKNQSIIKLIDSFQGSSLEFILVSPKKMIHCVSDGFNLYMDRYFRIAHQRFHFMASRGNIEYPLIAKYFIKFLKSFITDDNLVFEDARYSKYVSEWRPHRYGADKWLASLIRQHDQKKYQLRIQQLEDKVNTLQIMNDTLENELHMIKCKYAPELTKYDYDEIKRRIDPIRLEFKKMHRIISRAVELRYNYPIAVAVPLHK